MKFPQLINYPLPRQKGGTTQIYVNATQVSYHHDHPISGVQFNTHLKFNKDEVKEAFRKGPDRATVKAWVKARVKTGVKDVFRKAPDRATDKAWVKA